MNYYRHDDSPHNRSYHHYQHRNYARPRSHSPTPQPSRHSHSPIHYRNSRSPAFKDKRTRWSPNKPYYSNLYNKHGQRPFNQYYGNRMDERARPYYPYKPSSQSPTRRIDNRSERFQVSDYNPRHFTSPVNQIAPVNHPIVVNRVLGDKDEHLTFDLRTNLNEAEQIYQTDRQTIAQVTQLLIDEDKDLEDRLVAALERLLTRLKESHQKHMDNVKQAMHS